MPDITIVDPPARPATGDGEIVANLGGREVLLAWKDGRIFEASIGANKERALGFKNLSIVAPEAPEAIACMCCLVDEVSGAYICYFQPCGQPCP